MLGFRKLAVSYWLLAIDYWRDAFGFKINLCFSLPLFHPFGFSCCSSTGSQREKHSFDYFKTPLTMQSSLKGIRGVLIILFSSFFLNISAQETNPEIPKKPKIKLKDILAVSGYVKYLNQTTVAGKDLLINDNILHNRINLKAYLGNYFEIKLEARNRILYGESVKNNPLMATQLDQDDGLIDMSWNIISGKSLIFNSKIDRAYLNFYKGKFDIKLGRQRINWGITNLWNPNDLFNAYNFLDFDYEERPGTDALRIEYATSDMSTLDFAYRPAATLDKTTVALMYKFNKWNYDLQVLVANYKTDIALGLGWAGAIKGIGFKGETTFFQNRKHFGIAKGTLATSIGLDYSFKDGVYTNLGFLFNSNGINKLVPLLGASNLLAGKLSPKNLMPTKYSFFGQAQKSFGPAWSANVSMIYGAGLHLLAIVPNISYNIKENWDIDLTAQSFFVQQRIYRNIGNQVSLRLRYSY